jgi:hypothetical protein
MLKPIGFRLHSRKLPDTVILLIPMLHGAMIMALVSYYRPINVHVALMGSRNLMNSHNLRVGNLLILGTTQ